MSACVPISSERRAFSRFAALRVCSSCTFTQVRLGALVAHQTNRTTTACTGMRRATSVGDNPSCFMEPLIYLNSPDNDTLALGLGTMKQSFQELGTQWTLLLTASVIFTIPMMVLFFLFQRFFMEGATHSGIKG
jgi:hypothetical protein